jgi:hypothetical protein
MTRFLLTVLTLAAMSCVSEPPVTQSSSAAPPSTPAPSSTLAPEHAVSSAAAPHFTACADGEVCMDAGECEELTGQYGGPRCSGWLVCCSL